MGAKAQRRWHRYAATVQIGYDQGIGGRNRRLPNAKGSVRSRPVAGFIPFMTSSLTTISVVVTDIDSIP